MSSEAPMEEKMRTCPSCRTPISVLASKCKFCGEIVGKPKEESRQLSINDLGGETVHHRALSSSVMDALESFRIEDEQGATDGEGYAELDELKSPESSEFDKYDRTSSMSPRGSIAGPSAGSRLALVAKISVALVIVGVLAVKAPGFVKSTLDNESEARPEFAKVNTAMTILEANGDSMEALEVAVGAVKNAPSPENLKIADDVLDVVALEIDALLNSKSWTTDTLKEASRLASKMVQVYPSQKSTEIKEEVNQENIDYRMWLAKIDPVANTVTFQLNSSGSPEVTVKRGELIAERFKLISISGAEFVKLEDTKRNNRSLECRAAGSPK